MSLEARCKVCGEWSGLRVNFGLNCEIERNFHREYKCKKCKNESKQNSI